MGRIISYIIALVVGGFLVIATTESAIHSMFPPYPFTPRPIGSDVVIFMLIGHIILAYIPASIAVHKGHSSGKWFVYGFFLPPIAMIHSLLIKDYEKEYKVCPACAERVKKEAKVCRFCGNKFPVPSAEEIKSVERPQATYMGDKSEWDGDPNIKWQDRR